MKKFIEGMKDLLYDGIDYIMMIIVIVIVALVINWRLGGLFVKDTTDTTFKEPSNTLIVKILILTLEKKILKMKI